MKNAIASKAKRKAFQVQWIKENWETRFISCDSYEEATEKVETLSKEHGIDARIVRT